MREIAFHTWPGTLPQAGCELAMTSMLHPPGTDRAMARERIRMALTDLCAGALGLDPGLIAIASVPGKAPVLMVRGYPSRAGISISHDEGRSVAAFHANGPVGLDVMMVREAPDWREVGTDYLGPDTMVIIEKAPASHRPELFARAWTGREARLKCLGQPLQEWRHDAFDVATFALSPWPGWVGTLACKRA